MALTSEIRRLDLGILDAIRHVSDAVRERRARRAAYRQTLDELDALNDRELNDLGISRSDILSIAREAARQA